jgi:hypothetical protein
MDAYAAEVRHNEFTLSGALISYKTNPEDAARIAVGLSPSVLAAATQNAQRRNLPVQAWLEEAAAHFCAWEEMQSGQLDTPWSPATSELFARVAHSSAEIFSGPWSTIWDVVRRDRSFWIYPKFTMGDLEDGYGADDPYLDVEVLRNCWPRLVALAYRC